MRIRQISLFGGRRRLPHQDAAILRGNGEVAGGGRGGTQSGAADDEDAHRLAVVLPASGVGQRHPPHQRRAESFVSKAGTERRRAVRDILEQAAAAVSHAAFGSKAVGQFGERPADLTRAGTVSETGRDGTIVVGDFYAVHAAETVVPTKRE